MLPQLRRTPFRAAAPERVKVADALGEVALFTGCATEFLYPEVGQATVNLLASSGWQVWIPPLQTCCGFPSLSSGDSETAESCLEKNQRALQGWSGTAVVVVCATCGSRLKEALGSCGQTVVDATELLVRSLDRGRLPRPATGAGGDLPVTYHEACHLVRGQGLSQGPRELLKWAAPGGFVELEEADRCCGFGGVFSAKHYARSRAVGQRKVEKVLRSGARTLVAECPGCVMHLRDMLQGLRVPVRTVHLMEFLDRRLRGGAG